MIPKIIHFIWLGNSRKPTNFEQVLESWSVFAPEFTVREWGEKEAEEFVLPSYYHRAMQDRQYAFASDVLRFYILERYGGIYLDVDEILVGSIDTKELLQCTAFLAKYHESDDYLGFGAIGSKTKSDFSRKMIEYYQSAPKDSYVIVNKIGSSIALSLKKESPEEMTIFPQEYFYPLNTDMVTYRTYGKHLANTSWIPTWKKLLHKLPFYINIKRVMLRIATFKQSNIEY